MKSFKIIYSLLFSSFFILQPYAHAKNCPETFPKSQRISSAEMEKIIKDAEENSGTIINQQNISANSNFTIPDSGEAAITVFAIIGLVVIVAWVPYAISYLYDLGREDTAYCPWYRLSLKQKSIKKSGPNVDTEREASFTGIQFAISSLKDDYSFLGLAAEVGTHKIKDLVKETKEEFNGSYFLLGPSIALGKPNNDIISLDLLGGTSTNQDVSIIGEASLNWNINLDSNAKEIAPTLNFNIGANYLDIKENEGLFKNMGKYSLFWGFGIGVSF